jgi:RHS repeat-associated protein
VDKEYYDGSGRKIQEVIWKGTPSKNDIVQPALFDENGNAGTRFLPYKSTTTDAGYHSDMLNEQYIYNKTAKANFTTTEYGYSRAVTEASPANRIKEWGSVGLEFQPEPNGVSTNTTRTVMQKFYIASDNSPATTEDAIKFIRLLSGPTLQFDEYSLPAEPLMVTEIIDEDKKMKRTYTNNRGLVILERRYATNGTTILTQTYNVYDKFDRLIITIQPEGLTAARIPSLPYSLSGTSLTDYLDMYCFQYNYDERGRLIARKAPGGGWTEMAYDRWDRLTITQDANQKLKSPQEFSYIKYDALNRPIVSGTFKAANRILTMAAIRTELANTSLGARFETRTLGTLPNRDFTNNLSYPKADATNTLTPLAMTYYDDYKYTDIAGLPFSPALSHITTSAITNPKGLVTGIKTNILGTSTWTTTARYYDQYGNLIQTRYANINNVVNVVTNEYDFQGRLLKNLEDNKITASAGVALLTTNQYDHIGRLIRTLHKVNSDAEIILADYKYTDLGGKIAEKNLYGGTSGASYLQSVDFTFNEKGWLTHINNADLTNDGTYNNDANDLFGMEFKYYKDQKIDNTKAFYNGNILEAIWKRPSQNKKAYQYNYDDLNRITSANYRVNTSGSDWTTHAENYRFSMTNVSYDKNGNIKNLRQNGIIASGSYGEIDNINYSNYLGNRLMGASDAVGATSGEPYDFQNGTNPVIETDYAYDANGNLIFDDNKKISSITYNVLNLPEQITFQNGTKTVYSYDALGNKLRMQLYTGATLNSTTHYLGAVQYLNNTVQFAFTQEGRTYYTGTAYRYDYFVKDQVGNMRLAFTNNGGTALAFQVADYYPFGNIFNATMPSDKTTRLFNGMDFQTDNGLTTFDFHARMYDPQIGRSFQLDPMAGMFASKSPYSFLANNPVMFTDPTGMIADPVDDLGDGDGTFGTIGPNTAITSGSYWFANRWNYRGGNGFLAAFRGARSGSGIGRTYITMTERYKDWYFYSEYTGMRFTNTKLEERYWTLTNFTAQEHGNNYSEFLVHINSHGMNIGSPTDTKLDVSGAMDMLHALTYRTRGFLLLKNTNGWTISVGLSAFSSDGNQQDDYFGNIKIGMNGKTYNFELDKTSPAILDKNYIDLGRSSFNLPNNGHLDFIELIGGYRIHEFTGNSTTIFYKQSWYFQK